MDLATAEQNFEEKNKEKKVTLQFDQHNCKLWFEQRPLKKSTINERKKKFWSQKVFFLHMLTGPNQIFAKSGKCNLFGTSKTAKYKLGGYFNLLHKKCNKTLSLSCLFG